MEAPEGAATVDKEDRRAALNPSRPAVRGRRDAQKRHLHWALATVRTWRVGMVVAVLRAVTRVLRASTVICAGCDSDIRIILTAVPPNPIQTPSTRQQPPLKELEVRAVEVWQALLQEA